MASKAQATKEIIEQLDIIKIKIIHTSKGSIKKVQRQSTGIGEIFWKLCI
jgi:hypothetical protein